MTSAPQTPILPPAAAAIERRHLRRLRLRPKAPATGHVDGAWWPCSRDLVTELPALLAVVAVRLGDVLRVSYALSEWNAAPRRLATDTRPVRLEGFHSRPAHTLDLVAADGHRLTLLVVPSNTDPTSAHRTMALAADRDNVQTVDDLLAAGIVQTVSNRHVSDLTYTAIARWEADGGRIPEQTNRCTS
ncbi:DUF5994 family protein [Saccharothrix violaceirubra]|uniref:Uncharacterized protein n=1 Tax=Saccharothrix violaceirubra TaxID=413306 RepID=A0A7W7T2V0_9PSEU|nr:DUF5994 family protein [Saccharothrix violaceirubra]MBB4965544.1 hypothetical protein [Saccharothrix violaceirubra]